MIFYARETYWGLLAAALPALLSIALFAFTKKTKPALALLLFTGFLLRLLLISIDPYLQDWDERFHALVAKNMMSSPFHPMLRVHPILPYNIEDWCCNHVWVHKQPLFLWQMALSMKAFGVNEIAMRIPSALMGTLLIWFMYDLAKIWTQSTTVAYLSALLFCFSYYHLELISGKIALDQNDAAFAFYVTASIWAFANYVKRDFSWRWACATGLLVGCAILNKWLTGLLVFGGWGLYVLLDRQLRSDIRQYWKGLTALVLSCLVFVPWQLYIMRRFPEESAVTYALNRRHIFEVLDGHNGSNWFHLAYLHTAYGAWFLPFLAAGMVLIFFDRTISRRLSTAFIAMILVVYVFFSIIVKTKMAALPYPANSLIWILIAYGLFVAGSKFAGRFLSGSAEKFKKSILLLSLLLVAVAALRPWEIARHRSINNEWRAGKINNTAIYKNFDAAAYAGRVILNCKSFEDVELMFYQDVNAYHWYPDSLTLDSLQRAGYSFAAFKSHTNQGLPAYIADNPGIRIIDQQIK